MQGDDRKYSSRLRLVLEKDRIDGCEFPPGVCANFAFQDFGDGRERSEIGSLDLGCGIRFQVVVPVGVLGRSLFGCHNPPGTIAIVHSAKGVDPMDACFGTRMVDENQALAESIRRDFATARSKLRDYLMVPLLLFYGHDAFSFLPR